MSELTQKTVRKGDSLYLQAIGSILCQLALDIFRREAGLRRSEFDEYFLWWKIVEGPDRRPC